MKSYKAHLETIVAPVAPPGAVARRPAFRSSALFPVFHEPGVRTRLLFLGYWMVKRQLDEVGCVLTLRSQDGAVLARSQRTIRDPQCFRIEGEDQLRAAGLSADEPFVGSLEIEFFASRDLVYPFPAVVVNYYGPQFSTVVHTAQRVFNDIEDASENLATTVPECGFNIYADDDREPFFAYTNGFEEVPDASVEMEFYNHRHEVVRHKLALGRLRPFQTVHVKPAEHVDLVSFLEGRVGAVKIRFDARWVFPRIIAGNRQRSLLALSVTHTFYDSSQSDGPDDYWRPSQPGYHPASLFVPVVGGSPRATHAYFYPILSPSALELDVEFYTLEGRKVASVPNAVTIDSPSPRLHAIPLSELAARSGLPDRLAAKIIARPARGSRLPSRIKLGLDLGMRPDRLPCNICTALEPFNPARERKPKTFRWAPILGDHAEAMLWFGNSGSRIDYDRPADVELRFYRESDGQTLERSFQLAPNGWRAIRLEEDDALRRFLGGRVGWFTATSSNPFFSAYYFVEHASGVVGGDHSF